MMISRASHCLWLRQPQRQFASTAPPLATPLLKLTSPDSARTYCLNLLRKNDHASHLLTAFQHPRARDAHIALRAFNIDVASIDSHVSNVTLGRMRMEFWRQAISSVFSGRPPAEPVTVLLHHVLTHDHAPLSKSFFLKVISAREQYLGSLPFVNLDALEKYAEATYGSLHYLSLEAVWKHNPTLDHIGSHIGKATGIAAVLRGIPLIATSGPGAVVLPLDVCAEFNLRQEDVIRRGGNASGLKDAVFKVATLANDHLITARKMLAEAGQEVTGSAFASFLPAVPTNLYLEKLEKADFDPFSASLQRKPWNLPWRLYRGFGSKTF